MSEHIDIEQLKSEFISLQENARVKFRKYKNYVDLYKEGFTGSLLLRKVLITRGIFINAFLTKNLDKMNEVKQRYYEISCEYLSEQEEHVGEATIFEAININDKKFVCKGNTNENTYLMICNNEKEFNGYIERSIEIIETILELQKIFNVKF